MTDLVIIGGGPAGLTAAIYAARAGLKVKICEKNMYGGQSSIIDNLENYPGFKKINGFEFANLMHDQAAALGAEVVFGEAVKVDFSNPEKKIITLSDGTELKCKAAIIANGLKRRHLGAKGESEFMGKGVSYCATCDGSFYKSQKVVVVGGGNTALEDALYLSNICSEVTLVVRKDCFRGEKVLAQAVKNKKNIEVKFETEIDEIKGDKFVNSVVFKGKDGKEYEKDVNGVFIAIGYEPDCNIYKGQVDMDNNGYFTAGENCETNVPGVYVAGDCRKKPLRQIVTATSDGAVSGNKAAEYVFNNFS